MRIGNAHGKSATSRRGATALRVTGGTLAGRRLRSPREALRPSSDRVREALFARLSELEGMAVLDLFAGTGALGIEALSRGAESLVCVDRARRCVEVIRRNLAELGLSDRARVVAEDAVRAVRRLGRENARFDLVLLDPPYASGEASPALEALVEAAVLAPGALVVLPRGRRHPLPAVAGLAIVDERRYGDTVVTRLSGEPARGSA